MSSEEKTKLKMILSHWVEHNEDHSRDFKKWAEKAAQMGENEVAGEIKQAVGKMDEITGIFTKTLERL